MVGMGCGVPVQDTLEAEEGESVGEENVKRREDGPDTVLELSEGLHEGHALDVS
jgi:hypothetical protein